MLRLLDSLFFHLFSQQVQGIYNWGTVLVFQTKLQFLPLVRGATHSQLSISVTFSGSPDCCHLREFILHTEVFLDMIIVIIIDHKGILWISLTVVNSSCPFGPQRFLQKQINICFLLQDWINCFNSLTGDSPVSFLCCSLLLSDAWALN